MTKNEGELYPININNYSKYILICNSTEEYMLRNINEYSELYGGEKKSYEFKYYEMNISPNDKCMIIKCQDDFTFYNFHNLSGWFNGVGQDKDSPDLTVAIGLHKTDDLETYYATMDSNNPCGDTLIGVFNDGNKFSIFLPEAYEIEGNISIEYNRLKNIGVNKYLESIGVNDMDLLAIEDREYKTVNVEMAIE